MRREARTSAPYDVKVEERRILEQHWTGKYHQPDRKHYRNLFLTDELLLDIKRARNCDPQDLEKAMTGFHTVLSGMKPETGFVPNIQFYKKHPIKDFEARFWTDPEKGSDITQLPLFAWTAWEIYQAHMQQGRETEGVEFLRSVYGEVKESDGSQTEVSGLRGAYYYFHRYRQNAPPDEDGYSSDPLIGVYDSRETTRDSSPDMQEGAFRFPRINAGKKRGRVARFAAAAVDHPIAITNSAINIVRYIKSDMYGKKVGWDVEKMREKYWVNDVMFNALYVDNLRFMARISAELGESEHAEDYARLAGDVEQHILTRMWDEDSGFFYNLNSRGQLMTHAPSVSGLGVLLLDNIYPHQLEAILEKEDNPDWFKTLYPIPSVPVHSKDFDPHHREKSLWRGPTFIPVDVILAERGLTEQAWKFLSGEKILDENDLPITQDRRIVITELIGKNLDYLLRQVSDMVRRSGFREMYDPLTGKGQRVRDLSWSTLSSSFDESKKVLSLLGYDIEDY